MLDSGFKFFGVQRIIVYCVCGLLFSVLLIFEANGKDAVLERIQKAYEGIKDIKGSFVQKSHIRDIKRTDIFKGTLMIKMPDKMRWQYSGENKHNIEVIINDGEMIIFQKNEKQAFKGRFDTETYGQAPIALLGGLGSIEKEFNIVSQDGKLLLRPKKLMGNIVSVEITPSDKEFPISTLSIIDNRSNRIDITIRDVTVNTGLADSAFDFSLPKGASLYEHKSR